jgi:hypothetical protein
MQAHKSWPHANQDHPLLREPHISQGKPGPLHSRSQSVDCNPTLSANDDGRRFAVKALASASGNHFIAPATVSNPGTTITVGIYYLSLKPLSTYCVFKPAALVPTKHASETTK